VSGWESTQKGTKRQAEPAAQGDDPGQRATNRPDAIEAEQAGAATALRLGNLHFSALRGRTQGATRPLAGRRSDRGLRLRASYDWGTQVGVRHSASVASSWCEMQPCLPCIAIRVRCWFSFHPLVHSISSKLRLNSLMLNMLPEMRKIVSKMHPFATYSS
jgi:hypothetical protein